MWHNLAVTRNLHHSCILYTRVELVVYSTSMASLTQTKTSSPEHISEEDLEEQRDEMEALCSIYPDKINVLAPVGSSTCSPGAVLELPIDVTFLRPIPVFGVRRRSTGIQLAHVPPLILRITYRSGYPSTRPPLIELDSVWLDATREQHLQSSLQEIWNEEYEGGAVVYGYIDRLSTAEIMTDMITQINFLTQQEEEEHLPMLIRYDQWRRGQVFETSLFTCPVCYEEVLGSESTKLDICEHVHCRQCFENYVVHHISAGSVDQLTCLDSACSYQLTTSDIVRGTCKEIADKFDHRQLQKALDSMSDIVFCPQKSCSTATIEESDNLAQCPACRFSFCTLCYASWHPGTTCMSPEMKLKMLHLKEKQGGSIGGKEAQDARVKLMQEQMSMLHIKQNTRKCPSCRAAVSKSEGCNKISCVCGHFFCNQCGIDITDIGYDHFYGEKKTCNLFDQEALTAWNRQHGGGQAQNEFRHDMQAGRYGNAGFLDEFVKCPRCRQQNAKREDKNNSLKCWACNTNFCACCKGLVAKGHYGKGVRQCPMHGPKR